MSGVVINSNVSSLRAQRTLSGATAQLASTYERLSSGQRINKASDDAAGLAIAQKLGTNTRVYTQAIRNVNDGLSALGIAEGALGQLTTISIRQKELAAQAANGSYSLTQRRAMNAEANALTDEFNRIIQSTKFNGIYLTDKSLSELRIQAGVGTSGSIAFEIGDELARTVGSGTFGTATPYEPADLSATAVELADLNRDGILDMVTGSDAGVGINVFIGTGDGSFGTPTLLNTNPGPLAPTLGDVNGDGTVDIVTAVSGSTFEFSVFIGRGDGSFADGGTFTTGDEPRTAFLADLNRDGALDILGSHWWDDTLSVHFGNGNGTFRARVSISSPGSASSATAGDVNGDGALDLVAGGTSARIFFGNGDGTFRSSVNHPTGGAGQTLIDINSDGVLDIGAMATGRALVFIGNGDGSFQARRSFVTGGGFSALSFNDMNGDGILDLMVAERDVDRVSLLIGNGDGTFRARRSFYAGDQPSDLAVGDLNRDGAPDVAVADLWEGRARVLLANPTEVTTAPRLNICTREGAFEALGTVEEALQRISSELGAIGSTQSRFLVTLSTLSASRENYAAAEARIMDADVAAESADLVKRQILQQAGAAVLVQANQQPGLALQLLRA